MRKSNWKKISAWTLTLSMALAGLSPAASARAKEEMPLSSGMVADIAAAQNQVRAGSGIHYLSDMTPTATHTGYGSWSKDIDFDSGKALELLMPDGSTRTFAKGLAVNSASPAATATYDVSSYAGKTFFSLVGVHYGQKGNDGGTVRFSLELDGKTVWESDGIREPDMPAEMVTLDIPQGASTLKLLVDAAGDGDKYDHGVWAKTCIVDDKAVLKEASTAYAEGPGYLDVGQTVDLAVKGRTFDESDLVFDENIQVTCTSSNPDVLSVEGAGGSWKVNGRGNGSCSLEIKITNVNSGTELVLNKDILVGEDKESTRSLCSPDGSKKIMFAMSPSGALSYYVTEDADGEKNSMIAGAATGLQTNLGDFSTGLTLVETSEVTTVEDSYDLIGGKKDHVDAVGNEMTLKFTKEGAEGVYYYVIARAYNDGVAFRYQISSETAQDLTISGEKTTVILPDGAVSQAMPFINHNEAAEVELDNSGLNGAFCMPLLYEANGTFCLISEAALTQEYAGAALYGDGTGKLEIRFSTGDNKATSTVRTSTSVQDAWGGEAHPWVSPWRYFVMGDLNTINGNTMAETLSPDSAIEDTSWIKPGVVGWTWLNGEGTHDYETYKEYIDLAAEMDWEYVLLDEGWQPSSSKSGYVYYGYYPWFEDLMDYANEKGVGIIVWANNNDLNTPEKQEVLSEWAAKGIKGVKPDFFNSHSQSYMEFYTQLYQKTAENHLLLNVHGAPKPTGERRTYPHLLTREGIFGAEQILFKPAELTARHNCTVPFVRNAAGPADYTPMLSTGVHNSPYSGTYTYQGKFTAGQMAAMPIMIESGLNCMADTAAVYLGSPTRALYQDLPNAWTDTQVLEAQIGDYATIMRESADGRYYIGTICDAARTTDISLDFLPEGEEYYAYIVEDGAKNDELIRSSRKVSSTDRLALDLREAGGALILLQKNEMKSIQSLTLDQHEVEIDMGEAFQLTAAVTPEDAQIKDITWSSSNKDVLTVDNGRVTTVGMGIATVTASCGEISDSCKIVVYPGQKEFDKTDNWTVINEDENYWEITAPESITIHSQDGGIYLSSKNTAGNEFFIPAAGNFEATVKMTFHPGANYQSAGLLLLGNNGSSYAGMWRRYHTSFGNNCLNMVNYNGSSLSEANRRKETQEEADKAVWLKLEKSGSTITTYYSYEEGSWTRMGSETNTALANAADLKIGIYVGNDKTGIDSIPAVFTNFTYKSGDNEAQVIPFGEKAYQGPIALEMSEPGDTAYVSGEQFDPTGYVFTVYMTDREKRTVSGSECTVTGYDPQKVGTQMVTFTYGIASFSVPVNVVNGADHNIAMLDAVCKAYEGLDTSAYTEESAEAFAQALADAQAVLGGSSETDAGNAIGALMAAAAGLTIDTTDLEGDIAKAQEAAKAAEEAAAAAQKAADAAAKAEDLKTLSGIVDAAKKAGENAKAIAEKALETAGTNAEKISTLQSTLKTVESTNQTAQAAAEAAKSIAEKAKADAQTAAGKAEAAQAVASQAEAAASEAQKLAENLKAQTVLIAQQNQKDKETIEKLQAQAKEAREAAEAAQKEADAAKEQTKVLLSAMEKLQFKSEKVELKSAKSPKAKQLKAAWKKAEGADGYEVRCALNTKFKKAKKVTVKSGTTLKAVVKKLKRHKKYYVQVRAFKTIDGEKVYTGYSNTKRVKVK